MRHGSFQNMMLGGSKSATAPEIPAIGDGATLLYWTDRDPATVTRIEKIRGRYRVYIRLDKATRLDSNGMSDAQDYEFTPDPDAREEECRFRKGRWETTGGTAVAFGFRSKYYDYSF